ncbi:hypothetical protein [Pedococcus bigeumensis]|uniref:hypothetical protein n=1 Tax=Pedococcus bigeumensis TaxID=433644 RepID=UPI00112ED4E9|nr:hypothetical protein [Pedococcus bigeumensis]
MTALSTFPLVGQGPGLTGPDRPVLVASGYPHLLGLGPQLRPAGTAVVVLEVDGAGVDVVDVVEVGDIVTVTVLGGAVTVDVDVAVTVDVTETFGTEQCTSND